MIYHFSTKEKSLLFLIQPLIVIKFSTMLHKKLIFIATMALAVIVCSCTKQGDFNPQETIADQLTNKVVKIATFGEQTGHPFSMENVIEAYNNLPTKAAFSESAQDILPTHLYVRFITSNLDEIDAIQKNKDFDYYQYPLDCEITDGFVSVDNPFLINGFPQYWCVVPIDYNLDKIACPYEIESELWMPSFLEDVNTKSIGNNVSRAFEEALFEELCHEHNLGEPEFTQTKSRTSYYPGGYVKYVDTELGTVGLEHIKVEAFNFWHNYKTYSTSTGYLTYGSHYFTGSFKQHRGITTKILTFRYLLLMGFGMLVYGYVFIQPLLLQMNGWVVLLKTIVGY